MGTLLDLRQGLRGIRLYTNPNPYDLTDPSENDRRSLLRFKQETSQLRQFPRLRRVQLEIQIPKQFDAYFEGMTIVESLSSACKEPKERVGAGLNTLLLRVWPYDTKKFEQIHDFDISWMWGKPSQAHKGRILEGSVAADKRIRVLIADGVDPNKEFILLEELRNAGSFLLQCKDDIVDMEALEPWAGVREASRLDIKERWGKADSGM